MSNYGDLSSEELKRTLAERQETLRKIMTPDEYKKFMQEIDDCQIKIDYSKFGKPVDFQEEKEEANFTIFCYRTCETISYYFDSLYTGNYPYSISCLANLQIDFY